MPGTFPPPFQGSPGWGFTQGSASRLHPGLRLLSPLRGGGGWGFLGSAWFTVRSRGRSRDVARMSTTARLEACATPGALVSRKPRGGLRCQGDCGLFAEERRGKQTPKRKVAWADFPRHRSLVGSQRDGTDSRIDCQPHNVRRSIRRFFRQHQQNKSPPGLSR